MEHCSDPLLTVLIAFQGIQFKLHPSVVMLGRPFFPRSLIGSPWRESTAIVSRSNLNFLTSSPPSGFLLQQQAEDSPHVLVLAARKKLRETLIDTILKHILYKTGARVLSLPPTTQLLKKSSNNVLKIGLKVHLAYSLYMTEAEITQAPGGLCNTNSFANYNHILLFVFVSKYCYAQDRLQHVI